MWNLIKSPLKQGLQAVNRSRKTNTLLIDLPLKPISEKFGMDRGKPIDRYYIEKFLESQNGYVKGRALEVAESTYSEKFGANVTSFEILYPNNTLKKATIIGDLSKPETLPENAVDCFIATQTYNFIYDFKEAIRSSHKILDKNGVLLATVSGISQISRYDMDRWGDYWRFTSLSSQKIFEEIFGVGNVEITVYGNAFAAVAFLQGLAIEDVDTDKLDYFDKDYECVIGIRAVKK